MLKSLRDEPGTQREYETIYILGSEASSEQIQAVNDRIRNVVESADGKLLRVENWGKRKLAYEIKKQSKGIYLYWRYLAPPQLVTELERNLRMLDTVLRYLTVKVDEDVDPNARPSDVTDATFAAAAETRPDEEDYYLGRAGGDSSLEDSTDDLEYDDDDDKDGEAESNEDAVAEPAVDHDSSDAESDDEEKE